ncbi:helix-turn-helix domain-containing protein [Halotalea alkalilenta]|uniref:helix-turn-helix domain-containing protein n=1 Tax=Halotalea alkalilenta TaxID=376489 RepID=UPI0004874C91|nr:XRE family transcriptional regulator [Halotalea alkalilenta]
MSRATHAATPFEASGIHLGQRIRSFRRMKGLSIIEVAERTGMSKSFLSRFERDIAQASVASLLRICDAIGIRPGELFESPEASYVPAGCGTPISLGGEGMREFIVGGAGSEHLMALYSEIEPGGGSGSEPYSLEAAADLVHIKSGRLSITIGEQVYLLSSGDTLTFSPRLPHSWVNPSDDEPCTALWVIVPPPGTSRG